MTAQKPSGTSIRVLLGCVIGLMGLILLGVGSQPLYDALVGYPAARRLAVVTEISHDLFDALANYRFERGGMLAALAAEEPVRREQRAQIVNSRDAGEQGYQKAVAMMDRLDVAGLAEVLTRLQQAHQTVAGLRSDTERAASLPKSERTPGLGKTLAATGDAYLDALAASTDLIDATIRMRDPVIEALVVVKRQGWVARSAAGDESSVVSVALAGARPWGSEQIRKAAEAAGRKRAAWNVVAEVATRADAPPGLKAAYDNALAHYFGKDQVTRQPVEDALSAGRLPDITATAWQGLALPSLESLGAPCVAALDAMMQAARAGVRRATEHLITAVAAMGTGLVLIVAGFFIVQFRVCVPMIALTRVMLRLADGDYAAAVPGADRRDELGAMARAVLTFRENGIRMQRLEAEAAAQRAQTEAERAASAQYEAARAAEQAAVVAALAAGLAGLAEGDLTCEIAREFAPDYARLRADFNAAVSGLRATVQQIKRRSDVIGKGTSEIAAAADDLAQRTEQQAASLEQTAAALDQVTAAVRQTAIGSSQAQTLAAGACDEAEQSGKVVGDAVQAMGEIEDSARQIGQIIGVIDEIAFQTNLLALNAGVEAARAGESGRGFAVIATEVRELAQRAADAARQIKTLITTSMRQVEHGVRLVDATGAALGRIRSGVSQINISISEIAASAREQATGLAEINIAVNQMDHTTQQNAAMVEQSTAATRSLARETEELMQSLARFRIEAKAGWMQHAA